MRKWKHLRWWQKRGWWVSVMTIFATRCSGLNAVDFLKKISRKQHETVVVAEWNKRPLPLVSPAGGTVILISIKHSVYHFRKHLTSDVAKKFFWRKSVLRSGGFRSTMQLSRVFRAQWMTCLPYKTQIHHFQPLRQRQKLFHRRRQQPRRRPAVFITKVVKKSLNNLNKWDRVKSAFRPRLLLCFSHVDIWQFAEIAAQKAQCAQFVNQPFVKPLILILFKI